MSGDSEARDSFKVCGSCHHAWTGWPDFLLDQEVRLLGLQASTEWPHSNLFVFEHSCGSTVSVLASRLRALLDEPALDPAAAWLFGSGQCRQHCIDLEDRTRCDRHCANARDRRVLDLLVQIKARGRLPDRELGPPPG